MFIFLVILFSAQYLATNSILLIEAENFSLTDFVIKNSTTNLIILIEENHFLLNNFVKNNSATNTILLIEENYFSFNDFVNKILLQIQFCW